MHKQSHSLSAAVWLNNTVCTGLESGESRELHPNLGDAGVKAQINDFIDTRGDVV